MTDYHQAEKIARALLPTVWEMFDEYGERLNPSAEADRNGSLVQARRVLACLTTSLPAEIERGPAEAGEAVAGPVGDATDAMIEAGLQVDADNEDERAYLHNVWHAMVAAHPAGAGPVGEAVAWAVYRDGARIAVRLTREDAWQFARPNGDQDVRPLYALPVDEPGEVERLRDEGFALAANQCRYGYGDEHGHHRCAEIDRLTVLLALKDAALTAALESKARLVEVLRDAQAFVQEHYAPAIDSEHELAQRIHAALASEHDAQGRAKGADALAEMRERLEKPTKRLVALLQEAASARGTVSGNLRLSQSLNGACADLLAALNGFSIHYRDDPDDGRALLEKANAERSQLLADFQLLRTEMATAVTEMRERLEKSYDEAARICFVTNTIDPRHVEATVALKWLVKAGARPPEARAALSTQESSAALAGDVRDVRAKAQAVLDQASDTYRKLNGQRSSIEGDDGEKCWIVPFDAMEELRAALAGDGKEAGR